jgi:malonyl-CoA decarboxylase
MQGKEAAGQTLREAVGQVGDPLIFPALERFRTLYTQARLAKDLTVIDHVFAVLGRELEIGSDAVRTLADARAVFDAPLNPDDETTVARLMSLRDTLDSPRLAVLSEFVNIPHGLKFLVDLRTDLRDALRRDGTKHHLKLIETDLFRLFRSWFNFGFLRLVPINWETTSAGQLEKLMTYEVVHPMTQWSELRRRLDRDRLCYAFYHVIMPDEPLIFVEIALTRTILGSIDRVFDPRYTIDDIAETTTAMFYSINSTPIGLAGVPLGNSLIKLVVRELKNRYPNLKRFATISPMPAFRGRYVEPILRGGKSAQRYSMRREQLVGLFDESDRKAIVAAAGAAGQSRQAEGTEGGEAGGGAFADALAAVLDQDDWTKDAALRLALKGGLLKLAHHYLVHEKRNHASLNPVANFHLSNGACLYNLNFLSNTSERGLSESYGMAVNYHYDLPHLEENQKAFQAGTVVVAPQLEKMLAFGASG